MKRVFSNRLDTFPSCLVEDDELSYLFGFDMPSFASYVPVSEIYPSLTNFIIIEYYDFDEQLSRCSLVLASESFYLLNYL